MSWRDFPELIPESSASVTLETDIAVVGLGYSGAAALRAAQENGAEVIGMDTMAAEHYNSFGRDFGHINSRFLRSRGVPAVDPIDCFNEWMRRAGNRANPQLVMKFCKNCGDAFDWFTDMYGIEGLADLHVAFWPEGSEKLRAASDNGRLELNGYSFWFGTAEFPEPMGWPGKPSMTDAAKANIDKACENGAKVLWRTEGMQPIMDGKKVIGVYAKSKDGTIYRILTRKGVILAAGDFSNNTEMFRELCCDITDLVEPCEKMPPRMGRTGRGVQMGVWAGGRLENRPLPTMQGGSLSLTTPATFGSLMLDSHGKRFCNEVFGGTEISGYSGNQCFRGNAYVVFDEHYMENEIPWSYPGHGGFDANIDSQVNQIRTLVNGSHEPGVTHIDLMLPPPHTAALTIYTGHTPEELVANAGLTGEVAENIIASIARYNELCAAGRDEDFGRDPRTMDPLTDNLFLQICDTSSLGMAMVTVGGLVTNERQQVLNADFEVIDGLYATGNCCGRRFGTQYFTQISGVSVGMAVTLGREAGKEAAKG